MSDDLVGDLFRWKNVTSQSTNDLADSWFASFEPKTVAKSLRANALEYDEMGKKALSSSFILRDELKLISTFNARPHMIGLVPVPILKSELGRSIIRLLDKNEMNYQFENRTLIDDLNFKEVPDDESLKVYLPWDNYFGSQFHQALTIYRTENGAEWCYWHSTILYCTRPIPESKFYEYLEDPGNFDSHRKVNLSREELERGVLTFDEWSTQIHLTWLAKCLFYIAETPTSSSARDSSRATVFQSMDESDWPIPHMEIHEKSQVLSTKTEGKGETRRHRNFNSLPAHHVQMGWLFDSANPLTQESILTTLTEGLSRISSCVQDGYSHVFEPNEILNFDSVVFSGNQLERRFAEKGVAGGYYRWVPNTDVVNLLEGTQTAWESTLDPEKSQEHKDGIHAWIGDEGVGNVTVASTLNDAMFEKFLPNEYWGAMDFYAPTVFNMDVKNQSTNAMSNWGVSYYLRGRFDSAIAAFEIALDRKDKFAEDEACFYLSKIYEKQGDVVKSEEYRKRCDAAGGYEPTFL
jgi:hypothetical protein